MESTFEAGFDELAARVTGGTLVGRVTVEQPYAAKQEVEESYEHPRGGQAHYTATSLRMVTPGTYEAVADSFLDDGGINGMVSGMERHAENIEFLAPVDTTRLRHSAHPVVESDEAVVYDRPAIARRQEQ